MEQSVNFAISTYQSDFDLVVLQIFFVQVNDILVNSFSNSLTVRQVLDHFLNSKGLEYLCLQMTLRQQNVDLRPGKRRRKLQSLKIQNR